MGKGPVESHMHLCLKLHFANGEELTKSNGNIKLVRIIKSYTDHKDLWKFYNKQLKTELADDIRPW